jgi:hypothetical protein
MIFFSSRSFHVHHCLLLWLLVGIKVEDVQCFRLNRVRRNTYVCPCSYEQSQDKKLVPQKHVTIRVSTRDGIVATRHISYLLSKKGDTNNAEDEDTNSITNDSNEPRISPFDLRKEGESSKKLFHRLLLFDNVTQSWNFALYAFVIFGWILNVFGYAYIPKGSFFDIDIGTKQERQFQLEINRSVKQKQRQEQQQKLQLEQQQTTGETEEQTS